MLVSAALLQAQTISSSTEMWIYVAVFTLGFLESLPFIGLTFPASVLLILFGMAGFAGFADGGTMMILTISGGMLSNAIGYEADAYAKSFIQKRPGLTVHIERARLFAKRYGKSSIFLARFRTFSRSLISLVSAENDVPRSQFYSQTFIALVVITCLRLGIGFLTASSLQFAFFWVTRKEGFLLGIGFLAIPTFLLWKWAIRKGRGALLIIFSLTQSTLKLLSRSRAIAPFLKRYPRLKNFIHGRFSRSSFFGFPLTCLILAILYVAHFLVLLIASYLQGGTIITVDTQVANLLLTFRTHELLTIFYAITELASPHVIIGILIVVTSILWVKHHRTFLIALWINMAAAGFFTLYGKYFFHRSRPSDIYASMHEQLFALPSGHATFATVLYGCLAYIVVRSRIITWQLKMTVLFLCVSCIALISFSRVYLGVHFTSDVLAGILVGLILLFLSIILSESLSQALHHTTVSRNISRSTLMILIGSCTAVAIAVVLATPTPTLTTQDESTFVAPKAIASPIDMFTVNHEPRFSETLIGKNQEPLNLVIVSENDTCLESHFLTAGWQVADSLSDESIYKALGAVVLNTEYPTAPMTPYFYESKPHTIGIQRETERKTVRIRHHLRLWKTPYQTPQGSVYVGTASFDRGIKWGGFKIGITHSIDPDLDTERAYIAESLTTAGAAVSYSIAPLVGPIIGTNFSGDVFSTDGQVAILVLRSCAQ